jgi:hypothetical protein
MEGKGSTFYLLVSTKRTKTLNKPPWTSSSHAERRAALLTDMPLRFDSICRNLRNWNVQVEALAEVDGRYIAPGKKPFDLVILDITSRLGVAQDTIARIKTDCPGARVCPVPI